MIEKIKWDSEFFGKKIGRLTRIPLEKKLKDLIQQAHKKGYEYLSFRLTSIKIAEIQLLEKHGFYLTDIGVVWEKKNVKDISNLRPRTLNANIREATEKDGLMLKATVKGFFKGSRFYSDPFFTMKQADMLYQSWIENSLRDNTIKVFIAEKNGFITCKILSKAKGSIPLVGVAKEARGQGIGTSLMYRALKWFGEKGIKTVSVRTQANNMSAMHFYDGLGFKIKHMDMTMNKILIGN